VIAVHWSAVQGVAAALLEREAAEREIYSIII